MTLAAILARHRGACVPAVPVAPLSDGAAQSEAGRAVPIVPAVPAKIRKDERTAVETVRARLVTLAASERVSVELVEALPAGEVGACEGLPDEVLCAYLRALERGATMDAGHRPTSYTQAAHCDGCGPVWLWPGAPSQAKACAWCFRRKAGKTFPRPIAEADQ